MLKQIVAALILIPGLLHNRAAAEASAVVTVRISVPDSTPADARLRIGAAFNQWDPTTGDYGLTRQDDGTWVGQLPPFPPGKLLLFKITRGSWDTVEVDAQGQAIPDRRYKVLAGEQVLEVNVAGWEDQIVKQDSASTAAVEIIRETFELPTFGGERAVYIYLPSEYHRSEKRYPVIYMSDGRNLFDQSIGAPREWGMDELMERWQAEGSELTSIVVGIDHADANRTSEYAPWDYGAGTPKRKGKGALWADWLVATLKPSIDARYRTLPDREHTTVMGSSMGGLIACYAALRHQDVFSKAGCYSPAFVKRIVGRHWLRFIRETGRQQPMRIHLDMGDGETDLFGDDILQLMSDVESALHQAGFGADEIRFQIIADGVHNEEDWRARTPDILLWLNRES